MDQLLQEIGVIRKIMNDIKIEIGAILSKYPLLKYDIHENTIRGEIEVESKNGIFIDIFEIDVIIPSCYPKCFPLVLEKGSKIPRTMARHVMPQTNHLCFAVETEEKLLCKAGITLDWFFDKILIPRLCEEYRVNNGEKYQKEYSHDFGGTWEYLMKHFETNSPELVLKLVNSIVNKKKPRGDKLCICDSGHLFKDCHKSHFTQLQKLKLSELRVLFDKLNKTPYKGLNL